MNKTDLELQYEQDPRYKVILDELKKNNKSKYTMYTTSPVKYNILMDNGNVSYNVQNLLENEVNFPFDVYMTKDEKTFTMIGDFISTIYTDRYDQDTRTKVKNISNNYQFDKLSAKQLIEIGNIVSGRNDITGVRITRYTYEHTNNPYFRIDVVAKSKDTPVSKFTWEEINNKLGKLTAKGKVYIMN